MFFDIFRKFFVLYFYCGFAVFGQVADNVTAIGLGETDFPIERPFTISVIIANSETRPTINFPDITGFTKKGTSASVTTSELSGKTITNQVITQNYQARLPGRYRLPPFSILVNGETVESEGAMLTVLPSSTNSSTVSATLSTDDIVPTGAAFLALRSSRNAIYTGEGVALKLSFFVADNYPFALNFTALNNQLQAIIKKMRPVNSWEENLAINELKPIPAIIKGKKFREYQLYQSIFFPLSNQALSLPAVSLQLGRQPVIGPPQSDAEKVVFTSKPLTIAVRPLPVHPLRGRVPIGTFRLEERLERQRIGAGQSVRYTFTIAGTGNIATLPAPTIVNEHADVDVFPPEERHVLSQDGNQVTGSKTFTYFIVPHQNGAVSLANHFQWIYFDPQTVRYDTLRPRLTLQVGGKGPLDATLLASGNGEIGQGIPKGNSFYAGIEAMDSSQQPISVSALIRAIANVLIVIMLLGMIFVFFKK